MTTPYGDILVIITKIDISDMKRILVNRWSLTNLVYLDTFESMRHDNKELKVDFPLIEFVGSAIYFLGDINLPLVLGEMWKSLKSDTRFIIMDTTTSYNVILG